MKTTTQSSRTATPNFAMFTKRGNARVNAIVRKAMLDRARGAAEPEGTWDWILGKLEDLSKVNGLHEADDTAVREAAWAVFEPSTDRRAREREALETKLAFALAEQETLATHIANLQKDLAALEAK